MSPWPCTPRTTATVPSSGAGFGSPSSSATSRSSPTTSSIDRPARVPQHHAGPRSGRPATAPRAADADGARRRRLDREHGHAVRRPRPVRRRARTDRRGAGGAGDPRRPKSARDGHRALPAATTCSSRASRPSGSSGPAHSLNARSTRRDQGAPGSCHRCSRRPGSTGSPRSVTGTCRASCGGSPDLPGTAPTGT